VQLARELREICARERSGRLEQELDARFAHDRFLCPSCPEHRSGPWRPREGAEEFRRTFADPAHRPAGESSAQAPAP
jgi:hypothetical protein